MLFVGPCLMNTGQEEWWARRGAGCMEELRMLGGAEVLPGLLAVYAAQKGPGGVQAPAPVLIQETSSHLLDGQMRGFWLISRLSPRGRGSHAAVTHSDMAFSSLCPWRETAPASAVPNATRCWPVTSSPRL